MALLPHSLLPEAFTLGIGIFCVFVWISCNFRRNSSKVKLPPGPRPWPVVGNLHQLGILPHRTLAKLSRNYGPIMFLRLGSVPTVVVSSPDMAREILKTHDLIFASRPNCSAGKYLWYDHRDVGFAPYGEYWRQMKKLCTVELLSAQRIESYKSVREEEVSAMVRSMWVESGRGVNVVDVSKWLSFLSRNIICKMFASKTYLDNELSGGHGFKEMVEEIFALLGVFCIGDFIPSLNWLDLQGFHHRMRNVAKIFDGFAEKVIDDHVSRRNNVEKQEQEGCVKDIVDVLLDRAETESNSSQMKITRADIKGIIFDMLNAGVDTSTTTIEWAISELLRNPLALARVQEELVSVVGSHRCVKESDVASCEYLRCVVKETFRLHPVLPFLTPRESREGSTMGGFYIPPKARVFVNVWAMGRDESVWEDAGEFKPERFIGKDIDVKGKHFELLPFGGGRRVCPGILSGLKVVELALAQLLHCFDWSVEGEVNMEERFGISVSKKIPLVARLARRLSTVDNGL